MLGLQFGNFAGQFQSLENKSLNDDTLWHIVLLYHHIITMQQQQKHDSYPHVLINCQMEAQMGDLGLIGTPSPDCLLSPQVIS